MLPKMKYGSGIKKVQQIKFAGLEHTMGGGDGNLYDMQNLTGDHFPLLATRQKRMLHGQIECPQGLFSAGGAVEGSKEKKLCYVAGDRFYFDGVDRGTLNPACGGAERFFAELQGKMVIFPDKMYYDLAEDSMGDMEAQWTGNSLQFQNGTYGSEAAERNTLYCAGASWGNLFRKGDAVTIEGCTAHPENNKTIVVREIDGDYLRFYENSFLLNGDGGNVNYTENGELKVSRKVPDLVCVCTHENRLWGADNRMIYCGKRGDIFNFHVFDGTANDCWQWEPGTSGSFTACISYRGYPVFFKEDMIYKVYGSIPSEYQAMESATLGVIEKGGRSLAVAGETLFYLSRNGVVAYQGGIPTLIGQAMGTMRFTAGVAGSDGLKYYASLQGEDETWRVYVYDTENGMWHIEDNTQAVSFTRCEGVLYFMNAQGKIYSTHAVPDMGQPEENIAWWAEFGDITEKEADKKFLHRLQVRLALESGASVQIYIQYDSSGIWQTVGQELYAENKRTYTLPIIPRRCDHYRLKLVGQGQCYLYSIAREFSVKR